MRLTLLWKHVERQFGLCILVIERIWRGWLKVYVGTFSWLKT